MHYDYSFSKRPAKKSRFLFFIIFLILAVFILINNFWSHKSDNSRKINQDKKTNSQTVVRTKEELISSIRQLIADKPGIYSVLISDFKNSESFGINENTIFTAASVNKIPILAVLYYLAESGEIDLDKDITLQKQDIQDGTGSIRYDAPGTVYSYKTLARLMMEKSDNTAAYLLSNQIIGVERIQKIIEKWGLKQTDIKNNKTSNKDQEKLLRMIYEKKIAGESLTQEMLDFMDESDFEDRLPVFLPKDISVYHKIGNEIRNTHDVGIVDLPNKPYYIGVFTMDNPNEDEAKRIIAEISKLTFDYFTNTN